MSLRFDGKVAIVTGAGNGLGRTYALDLARRGCKVVVNDLGGSARGEGADTRAADIVVQQIKAAGGEAIANYDSVTNGANIVKQAIDTWKRIDIVINNAGILRDISFHKMAEPDWKLLIDVHLNGVYAVTRAAFPYMREQGYGRIIMVSSAAGLYGNFGQAAYSTVKMGLVGFSNTLAQEGGKSNILCNVVAPIAGSRMTETVLPPDLVASLKPEYVSPLVLYLVHESNKTNGGLYEVGAGWVSKLRWERSKGVFFPLNKFSIESVAEQIEKIADFNEAEHPTSPRDAFANIMENLAKNEEAGTTNPTAAEPAPAILAKAPAAQPTPISPARPPAVAPPSPSISSNPNVDPSKAIGHVFPPVPFSYTERDVILYALGIGAAANPLDQKELQFVYENHSGFSVFPTFGVVVPNAALAGVVETPGLTFNPMMLLHGEQYMEIKAPIPTAGSLTSTAKVANLYDKGSGALLILDVSTKDESGKEILFNQYSLFIRGLGKFGGSKGPTPPSYDPPSNTPPDVVVRERTLDNSALLYRLSGDYNPLHIDPEMAAQGGFSQPILHGLCSFGYAVRAVMKHFCNNDTSRFKSVRVRFVKHVFPGETLVTEMWKVEENRIVFRVRVAERGEYVLSNACVELHPAAGSASTPSSTSSSASAPSSAPSSSTGLKAEAIFAELQSHASEDLVKKVKAIFRFDVTGASNKSASWLLNLKEGKGSVAVVDPSAKADCSIIIGDDEFVELMTGKLNPQKAFMAGKIKVKGNLMLAQKLTVLQEKIKAGKAAGGGEEAKKPSGAAAVPAPAVASAAAGAASGEGFKAAGVFAAMKQQLSPEIVGKVKSSYRFDITSGSNKASWLVDLKSGSGSISTTSDSTKADCVIAISDDNFVSLMSGKLNAQQGFMKGLIKVKGNIMLAQKLNLLQAKQAKL